MTEKKMNIAIFNEMLKNAQDAFENYGSCEVGTYTIADLQNWKKFQFNNGANTKFYHIEVGTFCCQYSARDAFKLCQKFAKLAKTKTPVFTKENSGEAACTFTMVVPKGAKYLANFVSHDDYVPKATDNVFLDVKNSTLCASDGHLLKTIHIEISSLIGEISNSDYVCISPKDIKRISGHCKVSVYKDEYDITTKITDESGANYIFKSGNKKYPNYMGIYPKVSRENGYIKFTKSEAKRFTKWLEKSDDTVCLETSGSTLKVLRHFENDVFREATTFELEYIGHCDMLITFVSKQLKKVCESSWDGGIWFTSCKNMAVFDCDNTDVTLLMPNYQYGVYYHGDVAERNTPVVERHDEAIKAKIKAIAELYNITLEQANNMYKAGALIVA